jgi:hypothetical protein
MPSFNRAPRLLPGLLLALLGLGIPPAAAAPLRLELAYAVAWIGLPAAAVTVDLVLDETSYSLIAAGHSVGVFALMVDLQSRTMVRGRRDAQGGLHPARFTQTSSWNGEERHTLVEFDADGQASRVEASQDDEFRRAPVPGSMRHGPDPLTALLEAVLGAAPEAKLQQMAFAGRRVTSLGLDCGAAGVISPAAGAVAATVALPCVVSGEVIAGGLVDPPPRRFRLDGPVVASVAPGLAAGLALPVRIEAPSTLGTVTVELTRLGEGGG